MWDTFVVSFPKRDHSDITEKSQQERKRRIWVKTKKKRQRKKTSNLPPASERENDANKKYKSRAKWYTHNIYVVHFSAETATNIPIPSASPRILGRILKRNYLYDVICATMMIKMSRGCYFTHWSHNTHNNQSLPRCLSCQQAFSTENIT